MSKADELERRVRDAQDAKTSLDVALWRSALVDPVLAALHESESQVATLTAERDALAARVRELEGEDALGPGFCEKVRASGLGRP